MLYQLSYIGPRAASRRNPKLESRNSKLPLSASVPSFRFPVSNFELERETGIEPATNSLEGCDSTTELLPHPHCRLPIDDFRLQEQHHAIPEPLAARPRLAQSSIINRQSTIIWWTGEGSNLRRPQGSADLQSAAFDRSATCPLCFILPSTLASAGTVLRLTPETGFI